MIEILTALGVKVERGEHTLTINAAELADFRMPKQLITRLRASILLVGPLLGRMGKAEFSHPGGDIIGKRSIETHIQGFEELGFEFKREDRDYIGKRTDDEGSVEIFLDEPSVTATENLIMAASYGKGKTILKNCAMEPHVQDLCNLLVKMGVEIDGIGSPTLTIQATTAFDEAEFDIGTEYLEIGTYAVAAAITGGKITLTNTSLKDLEPIYLPLQKMGILFEEAKDGIEVSGGELTAINRLHVRPWPGFSTDLMSMTIVLATQSKGISLLHDWMYESRMFFTDKLMSMGANIVIADPHRVIVYGPSQLWGREMETPDIRAGMALVLAALCAKGRSVINKAELIERGYENIVENLASLGADIQRID
jgi:UDP-N-acetylglucosamine 1-carboxyvinyltransferase